MGPVIASAPSRPLRGPVALAPSPLIALTGLTGVARALNDERGKQTLDVIALIGIGAYNVACLLGGFGLGWLADGWLDTMPVFTMVGLALGIGGGVMGTWFRIRPFLRD
ncbi:MAG: hypothetical protein GEU93_13405 [Propionibacteriales bacterium]|nr:hypothetical protein [Propionibacteriales bacterium]